jgi:hypothetical protein
MKSKLLINDFNLFLDSMKATVKLIESAKFIINENGLVIYSSRSNVARCEISTNAIYSDTPIEFSILDLHMFVKVLQTIHEIHKNDFSELTLTFESPFIKATSKKFKTKINTCDENIIEKWISKKIQTTLNPVFEFTTSSDMIKQISNHSFIFSDQSAVRVYLNTHNDMENNSIFATLGNNTTNLNNEITMKFGLVTFGKIPEGRNIILDLERLSLFNCINTNEIKISLMDLNVLVSKIKLTGKNDSYFSLNIYNTILKN